MKCLYKIFIIVKECIPEHVLMTIAYFFSDVNGPYQNAVARPTINSDRPPVCPKIRASNVENLDDEMQTEKNV